MGDAVRIASAGFIGAGRPCPDVAVDVAATRGLDLSGHRSQLLASADVHAADLIVVMDQTQRRALSAMFGRGSRDVLILGDLDPEPIETRAIQDPAEQSKEVCEQSYSRIERCVRQLVHAVAPRLQRAAALSEPELTA
jgi:protein-tyrosine phosphatase